jgi:hypothetical protein
MRVVDDAQRGTINDIPGPISPMDDLIKAIRRVRPVYFLPYLLAVLSVLVALNPAWLQDFPKLKLYEGQLSFSGQQAIFYTRILAERFPDRLPGTETGQLSAGWMAEEFRAMGLETSLETFDSFVPQKIWDGGLLLDPIAKSHQSYSGTNVIAFSRGQTPVTVVILAHRDEIVSNGPQVDYSASDSATLLELARVLTQEPHYYSYLFVSTDGETIGQQGSSFLVRNHPGLSPRLVISLNDMGYASANTVGLANYGNSRSSTPLWTVVLAHEILAAQNLAGNVIYGGRAGPDEDLARSDSWTLLRLLFDQRGPGLLTSATTDAFLDRGDPVLGVSSIELIPVTSAAAPDSLSNAGKHTHSNLDQMSPASLEMSGRYIEQYVRSLEYNQFDDSLLSRLYIVWRGRYLPPGSVQAFAALLHIAFALSVVLPFIDPPVEWRKFANFVEREAPSLGGIIALSLSVGLLWQLPRLQLFQNLPIIFYLLMTVNLVMFGGVRLLRMRQHSMMLRHFAPTVAHQRRLLGVLMLAFYLSYSALFSPFTAALMLLVPFLLWSVARFQVHRIRNIWMSVFYLWTAFHLVLSTLALYNVVSRFPPWAVPALFAWALNTGLWLVVLIFVFSHPPLGVVARK